MKLERDLRETPADLSAPSARHHKMWLGVLFALFCLSVQGAIISVDPNQYAFTFTQSVSGFTVSTRPATYRMRDTFTTAPTATGSTLSISCAREEVCQI